jgi:hypothetical protein
MLNKTKNLLHEQIWVPPCAPCYKNVQVQKKLIKIVNVYSLSDLVKGGGGDSSGTPPTITITILLPPP